MIRDSAGEEECVMGEESDGNGKAGTSGRQHLTVRYGKTCDYCRNGGKLIEKYLPSLQDSLGMQ